MKMARALNYSDKETTMGFIRTRIQHSERQEGTIT